VDWIRIPKVNLFWNLNLNSNSPTGAGRSRFTKVYRLKQRFNQVAKVSRKKLVLEIGWTLFGYSAH